MEGTNQFVSFTLFQFEFRHQFLLQKFRVVILIPEFGNSHPDALKAKNEKFQKLLNWWFSYDRRDKKNYLQDFGFYQTIKCKCWV